MHDYIKFKQVEVTITITVTFTNMIYIHKSSAVKLRGLTLLVVHVTSIVFSVYGVYRTCVVRAAH